MSQSKSDIDEMNYEEQDQSVKISSNFHLQTTESIRIISVRLRPLSSVVDCECQFT